MQKKVIKYGMMFLLNFLAFTAYRKSLRFLTYIFTHFLALLTIRTKGIKPAKDLTHLGRLWQKGFPSAKQVPIVKIDEDTVWAEIHTPCPLRGSGNAAACHAMMHFDRTIVKQAGGTFEVLESQATNGKHFCRVAMQLAHQKKKD